MLGFLRKKIGRAQQGGDDLSLVRRFREGDQSAMRALYDRHCGRVYVLAKRLRRSEADAQDVVQDTFLKAWRNIDAFRGDSSYATWLYRIALNRCRDLSRRGDPSESLCEAHEGETPVLGDSIARKRLEEALAQLPAGYREVLVLHDVMELDHGEIAGILGAAVGTSKSQLHKARAKMRELLACGPAEAGGACGA